MAIEEAEKGRDEGGPNPHWLRRHDEYETR